MFIVPEIEEKFNRLRDEWLRETILFSFDKLDSKPYLEIIEMGSVVVPLILKDMEKTNNHWFRALREITGAQPVSEEHRGKIKAMCRDWLEWARKEGVEW